MKFKNLILGLFILGCAEYSEIEQQPEDGYIDYTTCREEQITWQDRFLLDHVKFQEGQLICSLDESTVIKQGISKQKYAYFLEYLRNKNTEFDKFLDSGMIIVYNGIPFTRNKELFQCIEFPTQSISRATEYDYTTLLYTCRHETTYSNLSPLSVNFLGPAKLTIYARGRGEFELTERNKGLTFRLYADAMSSETICKWGVGNYTNWSWSISHTGSAGSVGYVDFYGHFEKEPPVPAIGDERYLNWRNNLPSYITVLITGPQLRIEIRKNGSYTVGIYRKTGDNYSLLQEYKKLSASVHEIIVPYEDSFTYWIVFYEDISTNSDEERLQYIGDIEIRPAYMEGMPYE